MYNRKVAGVRQRVSWWLLITVLPGLLLAACTSAIAPQDKGNRLQGTVGPGVGQFAPDFSLVDLGGEVVSLKALRGKVVFLNFWATWCLPCRAEMPEIEAVYQMYKDKGVVVIGVDMQETADKVRRYVQNGGFGWTFVLDRSGAVASDYRVTAIPTSFFIDRQGVVQAINIGAMTALQMESGIIQAIR